MTGIVFVSSLKSFLSSNFPTNSYWLDLNMTEAMSFPLVKVRVHLFCLCSRRRLKGEAIFHARNGDAQGTWPGKYSISLLKRTKENFEISNVMRFNNNKLEKLFQAKKRKFWNKKKTFWSFFNGKRKTLLAQFYASRAILSCTKPISLFPICSCCFA